ncbi:MAG: cytochrome c3 family protein [Gemmatimonadota bacterium]
MAQTHGAAAQAQERLDCTRCHSELEFLRQNVASLKRAQELVVMDSALARSAHGGMACVRCHAGFESFPHNVDRARTRSCASCHPAVDSTWQGSVHAHVTHTDGIHGANCTDCHGVHDVRPVAQLNAPAGRTAMNARCESCHATVRLANGNPHKDNVACFSCHGAHHVLPPDDPASSLAPVRQPQVCGSCHDSIAARWVNDVHGSALMGTRSPIARPRWTNAEAPPACTGCHGGHDMVAGSSEPAVQKCSECHEHAAETYQASYHGQAVRLGSPAAATCAECHGAHDIEPATNPASTVARGHLLATCRQCHTEATASFTRFEPHADHADPKNYPLAFWAYHLMLGLLVSVFLVFGAHTVLWLIRLALDSLRKPHGDSLPAAWGRRPIAMDAAQRGAGPFVWRFSTFHRLTHALVIVSFFILALTGLPLRFSCTVWAGPLMSLWGGVKMAGLFHRIAAGITFTYFGGHLIYLVRRVLRAPDPRKLFWGPDSLVPQPHDVLDFWNQFRWYFGLGPRPQFGRWSYMEKFDYFAVFWGVAIIGGSGLLLWFPEFFAHFLPGWVFNVATIIHGDEALLAVGFIFTIHFFHVHLRPEKFPIDQVMFTGRATLDYMNEEHPGVAEQLGDLSAQPVSQRAVQDRQAPAPTRRQSLIAAGLGFLALGIGVATIGLILWAVFC